MEWFRRLMARYEEYKFFRTMKGYGKVVIIGLGVKAGLLQILNSKPMSSEGLAMKIGGAEELVDAYCKAAYAYGVLNYDSKTEKYSVDEGVTHLLYFSPYPFLRVFEAELENLPHIAADFEKAVKTGQRIPVSGACRTLAASAALGGFTYIKEFEKTNPRILTEEVTWLDVGCGDARYLKNFAERNPLLRIVGVEADRNIVEKARENVKEYGDRITVIEADFMELDLDKRFDFITLFGVLHYLTWEQLPLLFRRARELLKEDGRLVVVEAFLPDKVSDMRKIGCKYLLLRNLYWRLMEGFHGLHTLSDIHNAIKTAGLQIEHEKRLIPYVPLTYWRLAYDDLYQTEINGKGWLQVNHHKS